MFLKKFLIGSAHNFTRKERIICSLRINVMIIKDINEYLHTQV